MSGVFAIAGTYGGEPAAPALARMGARLVHRPWQRVDHTADPQSPIGLGRVARAAFNRDTQPVTAADGALSAVFSGIIWAADASGAAPSPDRADEDAARLIFAAYEEAGPRFAARLAGEFAIALWDRRSESLLVATDRYGSYPIYYARAGDTLLVAPTMNALFTWPALRKRLDEIAMASYLRFQCVLGERTFFADVHLLAPGTVLSYALRTETLSLARYWDLADVPTAAPIPVGEAVEETHRRIDVAVRRRLALARRPGLYLSGGLDSRLLLGIATAQGRRCATITFGQRRARDVVYAAALARRAGTEHHWFPLDAGGWVSEHAEEHLALTEGFQSWAHAHGISTLAAAREIVDVALTGFGGDAVIGGLPRELGRFSDTDDAALLAAELFEFFTHRHTWPGLSEAEEHVLYAPGTAHRVRGAAFDAIRAEADAVVHCRPALRPECVELRNHAFRFINHRTVVGRSHVEMPSPFYDYAVVDFAYALPPERRAHRALERAILDRCAPRLCTVPNAGDGFLPTSRRRARTAHAWLTRLRRKMNAHVAAVWPEPVDPYADYEHYLRTDLYAWAEDLLLGPRTRARGLFNPQFLALLWQRMQSGCEPDIIGKLAPIMTYEHLLRRFVDE
jgi:asparagine synthase (glutamine-hydrolysing)